MWWNIAQEMQSEFEDWHSHEHMPERLGIPGFLRGTRWIAISGEPSYFVLYEASRLTTLTGGTYLERLNDPTPWSRKMMPHHRNMVRSLCSVRASFGVGLSQVLATIRFSPSGGTVASISKWLVSDVMPELPRRKGLTGAHLLESQAMAGSPRTTEQEIRGRDAVADRVLLICGYDLEAVKAVVEHELAPAALLSQGALPDPAVALYRVAYCLSSVDKP
jgi:hypothetical protein